MSSKRGLPLLLTGDERPFGQRIPLNTADCEAAGGKCVTQGYSSQCGSADYMCVGQCDSVEETCLVSSRFKSAADGY